MLMPSRRDPTSKRLFDQFKQTRLVNSRKLYESLFLESGKDYDKIFDLKNDDIYLYIVRKAFHLGHTKNDQMLLKAFEAAGLDHRDPMDWRNLLSCFVEAHFGSKETKPVKWDAFYLNEVFKDYSEVKTNYPELKDFDICKFLQKDKRYKDRYGGNFDALRKLVRVAKNPKHNVLLRYTETSDPLVKMLRDLLESKGIDWDERLEEWAKEMVTTDYFKTK
jgi:hypothetical protein